MAFLDFNGLKYYDQKNKALYVQKDGTKVLSDNNYTDEEKARLAELAQSPGQANVIEKIQRNGMDISPDESKTVNIIVPIAVSELANDKKFLTDTEVQQLIADARHMKTELVEQLPTSGDDKTIYLVPSEGGTEGNVYDEYMFINDAFEKIGNTEMTLDLSGYAKTADLEGYLSIDDAIELTQIDSLFA